MAHSTKNKKSSASLLAEDRDIDKSTSDSKPFVEELISALADERVQKLLTKILNPLTAQDISKLLDDKIKPLSTSIENLQSENTALKAANAQLTIQINNLNAVTQTNASKIDDLSKYTRRNNLMTFGLKSDQYADAAAVSDLTSAGHSLASSNESIMLKILNLFMKPKANIGSTKTAILAKDSLSQAKNSDSARSS